MNHKRITQIALKFVFFGACFMLLTGFKCNETINTTFPNGKLCTKYIHPITATKGSPANANVTGGPANTTATIGGAVVVVTSPLADGNEFGSCKISVRGKFMQPNVVDKDYITWSATGTIVIDPPKTPSFQPPALVIPPTGSAPVKVTIAPPCTYEITYSHDDEKEQHLRLTPDKKHTTNAQGKCTITVTDALGIARGPITVTVVITPRGGNCVGAKAVKGTFTVTVK